MHRIVPTSPNGTSQTMRSWIFTNNLSGAVSDGILTLTIEGHDPFMHSQPSLNINAEDNWEILVKMKNNTPDTTGQLYFITTTYSGWSEDMLQTFSVIPLDSVYREYRIPMNTLPSWKGIIEQIRLDPLARANSGTVDIDYIMVTGPYMMILLYFRHHPLLDCPLNLLCQQVQP